MHFENFEKIFLSKIYLKFNLPKIFCKPKYWNNKWHSNRDLSKGEKLSINYAYIIYLFSLLFIFFYY